MYYDSHCHIYSEYYNDIDDLVADISQNDIKLVVNNGCNQKTNEEIIKMVLKYPIMYGAIGIHPEYVNQYTDTDLTFIEKSINSNKIIAIGEIGLDYHYSKENRKSQIELFEKQLRIAEKWKIPVIIHSRDATLDTLETLKKFNVRGIIHSFSGSYETAQVYIKMGFKLGINGVITFKNSNLKDIIKKINLENIVIETDSPYLTPHPYRGQKNTPKNVKLIVNYLSNLYRMSPSQVEEITSKNIKSLFDINMDL